MPIASGGELYPAPRAGGEVLAAWRELANRLNAELGQVDSGVAAARSGGSQVAGQAAGIETAGDALLSVVSGSRPSDELGAVAGANANAAGVSQEMSRAVGKAHDPNTDPGPLDADAANRAARGEADGINRDASRLGHYPEPPSGPGPGEERRL